jgi:hypothetical protein
LNLPRGGSSAHVEPDPLARATDSARERAALTGLLEDADRRRGHPLEPGLEILDRRSREWSAVVDELKESDRAGRLIASCREIAPGWLHMHANRMLRSVQRQQELVLYDLLMRQYESEAARTKRIGHSASPLGIIAAATS